MRKKSHQAPNEGNAPHMAGFGVDLIGSTFVTDGVRVLEKRNKNPTLLNGLGVALLIAVTILSTWANAQEHTNQDHIYTAPQMSDFTEPYTCPWFFSRPKSCSTPVNISVECVDHRNSEIQKFRKKALTQTQLENIDKACVLLPAWVDKDPRINVTTERSFKIKIQFINMGYYFSGIKVTTPKEIFIIDKSFQNQQDKASFFIEELITELEKKGYLP